MEISGYTIHKEIGAGGMARVYLATQQSFNRKAAIKVLDDERADDVEFAKRFIHEAKTVASLAHPHIIPVYDVGQHNGHIYMTMEYLPGGDLAQWIARRVAPEEALQITEQIAQALQFAHDKGVIHRDIKPDNIMFREDFSAVLTDFGIARQTRSDAQLTQLNTVLGTPKYMSPEQLMGKPLDGRSDLYALGIVLFEMLTGELPFDAEDYMELSAKHLNEPVPKLDPQLRAYQPLVDKLLAKRPEERFANGRALIKAISALRQSLKEPKAKPAPNQPAKPQAAAPAAPKTVTGKNNKGSDSQRAKHIDVKSTGVRYREQITGLGPFKKYALSCEIVTPDAHTFGIQFGTVTTRILEWRESRGKKAKAIHFNVAANQLAFERIRDTLDHFCHQSDGPYQFVQKLAVEVNLADQFGEPVDQYQIN